MAKFKIYDSKEFDLINGPIDEDYYERENAKAKKFATMYSYRNDGLSALNSELAGLCFRARQTGGFARESYIQKARALRLIIAEITGD